MSRPSSLTWIRTLALIVAYVLTGVAGLKIAATGAGYAAPIWLPTGIAVAVAVVGGNKYLPAIWLGAFITNFYVGHGAITGANLLLCIAVATGNMLEAAAARWLLKNAFRFETHFAKLTDVTGFISVALLCPFLSATIGMAAVSLASGTLSTPEFMEGWVTWWIGDALGTLILSPILMSLSQKDAAPMDRSLTRQQLVLPAVLTVMSMMTFGGILPQHLAPLFIGFLTYSIVVWCALVLPIRRFFYVLGVLAVFMTTRAYFGYGLFSLGDMPQRLALLQFFLGCITVTLMILNAVVSEGIEATALAHQKDLALMQSKKMSALGEMSSGIAHEISNPLLVIYGKTEQALRLVETGRVNSENMLPLLEKIDSMARRIEKIIKAIRFYSRKADVDPFKVVTVRSIVDDTLELCKDYFQARAVELEVDAIPDDLEFECRSVLIAQVLLNLLTNGLNAAEEHFQARQASGAKWVRLSARQSDDRWLEIAVTDSGPGINEQMREQIFKPFFTTKKAGEGTGLGLSVSRNIVESHHGSIQVDPASSNTRFVMKIPLRQPIAVT